jgi:hypothetical protein
LPSDSEEKRKISAAKLPTYLYEQVNGKSNPGYARTQIKAQ